MAYEIANDYARTHPKKWLCWPLPVAIPLNVLVTGGLVAFFAWIVSVGF
jgi:hypothetical protein